MADATELLEDEIINPVTGKIFDHRELAERLLAQAKEQGMSLTGPGGLLSQLTKNVLKTTLDAELTEHLGPRSQRMCATTPERRPCSPRSASSRSASPGIGPARSCRSSSPSASGGWTVSTRSCCRSSKAN